MKIKVKDIPLEKALAEPEQTHKQPLRPKRFWRWLIKTLAAGDGECNYWILGNKEPEALADVGSK